MKNLISTRFLNFVKNYHFPLKAVMRFHRLQKGSINVDFLGSYHNRFNDVENFFLFSYPIFAYWQNGKESRLNSKLHSPPGSNKENVYTFVHLKSYTRISVVNGGNKCQLNSRIEHQEYFIWHKLCSQVFFRIGTKWISKYIYFVESPSQVKNRRSCSKKNMRKMKKYKDRHCISHARRNDDKCYLLCAQMFSRVIFSSLHSRGPFRFFPFFQLCHLV